MCMAMHPYVAEWVAADRLGQLRREADEERLLRGARAGRRWPHSLQQVAYILANLWFVMWHRSGV